MTYAHQRATTLAPASTRQRGSLQAASRAPVRAVRTARTWPRNANRTMGSASSAATTAAAWRRLELVAGAARSRVAAASSGRRLNVWIACHGFEGHRKIRNLSTAFVASVTASHDSSMITTTGCKSITTTSSTRAQYTQVPKRKQYIMQTRPNRRPPFCAAAAPDAGATATATARRRPGGPTALRLCARSTKRSPTRRTRVIAPRLPWSQ